ncbi:cytochrome b561 and DOMON domain-containing protein At5g35735 [Selaginella moellendorffii]|nr:cytochrome b561 and DOMON domain-containing protein At5g35735 [Selaginella moellendorffii]XP_024534021.1 cytochrome b561 and DOMON domain-containing protein At5g35735 [Selaginella moellendorffii]|eukprot:XP_002962230.2 cytochrome b561 and DOMON domain-containing protein At5g35735 [Selaginella moellendorffii]
MASATARMAIFISILALSALIAPSAAQQCSRQLTIANTQSSFMQCQSLSQGAAIAWTFIAENRTLEIAFSGSLPSASGWVGWGYNPSRAAMDGASALIAFSNASGSHLMLYSLTGSRQAILRNSTTDVTVLAQAVEIQGTTARFTALLRLTSPSSNIFHIWNRGSQVNGDAPQAHALDQASTSSAGSLDLATGAASSAGIPRLHLRNAHGILNALGWGILLPIGAMSARYLRSFEWADPTWFYLHVACQTLGYILGVVGWAIGLRLGSDSVGVRYNTHRNIGITMFVFGTLQVFAIVLRPNKTHSYRTFWNAYHHGIGYATIALAIANIFKGFDILDPAKGWKNAYIGIIIALGVVALILEAVTWAIYFQRRRSKSSSSPVKNARNSSNPYAQEPQFNAHGRV